jgi:hypothetical protein
LYGCETWSLTLKEEHTLRVSEQGAEESIWSQQEGSGGRGMHNEEIHNLYTSLIIIIMVIKAYMGRY